MAGFNAKTEIYEEITLLEKPALFTGARLDRSTVPEGLYAYDVRHDDLCQGIPCEVANYIMVNHWGTVLMAEPLDFGEDGRIFLEEDDWNYASIPSQTRGLVGRISYLGLNGEVYQTTNYTDMESLKRDSLQSSDCGEPIQITLFERPEDTESILKKESDWVKGLNPVTCRISYEFIKGDRADCRTAQDFLDTYAPNYWRDRLCEKLYEEQQTYRNWLLEQPSEEILSHAYTYAMREDIVVAAEDYSLLTESQAKALCQSLSPMNEIYSTFDKRDASNMEVIADCITCRGQELEQKPKVRTTHER